VTETEESNVSGDEATSQLTRAAGPPSFEALLDRPEIVWMGQNTTHLEPPAEVIAALEKCTRDREFQLYAPALGFEELRSLIVEDLAIAGAESWVTDGAVAGLHHICTGLAPRISRVIATDPGWPWPGRFAQLENVPVTNLPIYAEDNGFRLTAAQVAEVIEPNSLIYLIDPINPLGSRYGADELEAIVRLARDTDSLIVHDCTYRHFATGHTLVGNLYPEGTFTTYSFSKWLGLAGLRLGAVVAVPELLARLTQVPSNPLGASIVAQRAAIAGLKVKESWLGKLLPVNQRNLQIVHDCIEESGIGRVAVWPSHGNFLAADVSASGWSADDLCAAMLDRDVFIRPGTYQSPEFGTRFIKVSTSVPVEWAERFAAAWNTLPEARA
jgi:aspartate/methionine/tyrosine aminotransferase